MRYQEMLRPTPDTEMALRKYYQQSSNDPPKRNLKPLNINSGLLQSQLTAQNNHLTIPTQVNTSENPSSHGSSAISSAAPSSSSCSMNSNFTHYKNNSKMTNAQVRLLNSPYLQPIISLKNPCLKNNQQLRNIYKSLLPMTTLQSKAINNAINGKASNKKLKSNMREPKSATRKLPNLSLCCEIAIKFTGGHSTDHRHQVRVYQQRCGGTPVSVYTGCLEKGEIFSFLSKRQHGFPFSITLYVDGMLMQRLSACCEYKHRQNCKLGGSKGQFVLVSVKGSFPCYRCQMSERRISLTPPTTKVDDNTEDRTSSASSASDATNTDRQPESENGESEYEDDFDDGEEDDHLILDDTTEHRMENEQENALETTVCNTSDTIGDEMSSAAEKQPELDQPVPVGEHNPELTQPLVNAVEAGFEVDDKENKPEPNMNDNEAELNVNDNKHEANGLKANNKVTSSHAIVDNEHEVNGLKANDQVTSSHAIVERRASTTSSSEGDHSTSNDDADASITSSSESNITDDEDVVCQADFHDVANEDEERIHNPLGKGGEWIVQASPSLNKRGQSQWTSYRDRHHQQFDSSDEEEANDSQISPRVTVTADVHASDFESPRTTQILL